MTNTRKFLSSPCQRILHLGQTAQAHIDAFIETYNADAKPFIWTKSEVHQKRLKARFADQ